MAAKSAASWRAASPIDIGTLHQGSRVIGFPRIVSSFLSHALPNRSAKSAVGDALLRLVGRGV
jgi:hypothetical protein